MEGKEWRLFECRMETYGDQDATDTAFINGASEAVNRRRSLCVDDLCILGKHAALSLPANSLPTVRPLVFGSCQTPGCSLPVNVNTPLYFYLLNKISNVPTE